MPITRGDREYSTQIVHQDKPNSRGCGGSFDGKLNASSLNAKGAPQLLGY